MSGKIAQRPIRETPKGVLIQQRITRVGLEGQRYEKSRAVLRGILIRRAVA